MPSAVSSPLFLCELTADDILRVVPVALLVRAVPGRDCLDWNVLGAGVMASTKAGFPDHNGENLGMPGSLD